MSSKTITIITDDIDGSQGATTTSFAFDGTFYTIDLNEKNHERLFDALSPFIAKATRSGKYGASKPLSTVRGPGGSSFQNRTPQDQGRTPPDLIKRIREWAAKNGVYVPPRGRIPGSVLEAYTADGGK